MSAAEWPLVRPAGRRRAVNRAQVETVVSRALGAGAIVFGVQTVPAAIDQAAAMVPGAGAALMAVLYGSAAALAVAAVAKVAVRTAAVAFAALYAAALIAWPFVVADPAALHGASPWLYYLCSVATTAAAVAFPVAWATGYAVVVPLVYGAIRLLPAGGSAEPLLAVLDTVYAIILGVVLLIIVVMLRHAAEGVDTAQEAALQRYDTAARLHANELERVRVDALVHDSVLATLLAAAAATTDEEQVLASRMAVGALGRLREAGTPTTAADGRVPLTVLVRRLRAALTTFSTPFTVRVVNVAGVELTVDAVDALYSAAVQAMVNSLQHADDDARPIRRELRIRGVRATGCVIEVADDGGGFDPAAVPSERLGLRVSIEERLRGVGGMATIESAPGRGTTVSLGWPAVVVGG
ncbi:sensor histidine kinase [Agromyces sp. MMS24-K17]|uniref:sensor histidine kinase n=1 Tax=Agromyces sp. MMS24-K17 TaxID=3372850 RepID=UPI00375450B8